MLPRRRRQRKGEGEGGVGGGGGGGVSTFFFFFQIKVAHFLCQTTLKKKNFFLSFLNRVIPK